MNKQLSDAVDQLSRLPDDTQKAAAALLFDFLETDQYCDLTADQIAEIERRLEADEIASDDEVQAFFARMKA